MFQTVVVVPVIQTFSSKCFPYVLWLFVSATKKIIKESRTIMDRLIIAELYNIHIYYVLLIQ